VLRPDRSVSSYRSCHGKSLDSNAWIDVEARPTPQNSQRFIRAIQSGVRDLPEFQQGADAQRVLDACLESAELDRPLSIGRCSPVRPPVMIKACAKMLGELGVADANIDFDEF
jgi:hypothetical protein